MRRRAWWRPRPNPARTVPTLPARQAYDRWAATYPPRSHNALMQAEHEAMSRHLTGRGARCVLDAGAGSGRYTPLLAATGAATIVSLDWSFPMLRAHTVATIRVCGDTRVLPFPAGTFDLVHASLVAGDIVDLAGWVTELARTMRPGGVLLYSDFHPAWSARGWQRTFVADDGATYAIACVSHALDDHATAIAAAGLEPSAIDEVRVQPPQRSMRLVAPPAVPGLLVIEARKPWPERA